MSFDSVSKIEDFESGIRNDSADKSNPLSCLLQEMFTGTYIKVAKKCVVRVGTSIENSRYFLESFPLGYDLESMLGIIPLPSEIKILEAYKVNLEEKSRTADNVVVEITLEEFDYGSLHPRDNPTPRKLKLEVSYKIAQQ